MTLVFATESRAIIRYQGRVPPRLAARRPLEARVDYEFAVPAFR